MRRTILILASLVCHAFLQDAQGGAPLCDGHACKTNWELRSEPSIVVNLFGKAGDNSEVAIDAVRTAAVNFLGCVCACSGDTVSFRVAASDKDDHMCQGVVTGQVSNFILQSTALSVRITGTGITNTVSLVSTQAVDVVERTWTGSWAVPTDAAGQMLDFQFGGIVADKPCAAHGGSDDPDVSLDGYKGQFAVVKVDIEQAVTNTCWKMAGASVNLTADSYWAPEAGGSVIWTNIPAGLGGVSVSEDSKTFSFCPGNSTPGTYVVKAWSSLLPDCMDTATVNVYRVELTPKATNVCWKMADPVKLTLTNSWSGAGGSEWTGTNGLNLVIADNAKLVFIPANSVPTNYTVRATARGMTNCWYEATVNILTVEFIDEVPDYSLDSNTCLRMILVLSGLRRKHYVL